MILATLALSAVSLPAIIPQPVSVQQTPGMFVLSPSSTVVVNGDTKELGATLCDYLRPATGYRLPLTRSAKPGSIRLQLDKHLSGLGDEGYRLTVTPEAVNIVAPKKAGIFYGIQSLRQMLPTQIFKPSTVTGVEWTVPCATIEDQPRFSWRGAHLDVGRNFMPKQFVLKYIDLIAMHKLNVFHWHLTDDQGWRIEIKKYPRLTSIGSKRPDTMLIYSPATYEGKPESGFYTQEDIKEVVAFAAKRFVTVVPEIEMPGHSSAAIAAYPQLGNTGKQIEVPTHWGVIDDVYNVNDSTISFLQDVLGEVMGLFPSKFVHVGGDEVPKTQWHESPKAQAKIKALGLKDERELQSWFIHQMDTFLSAHGRRLVGWDEILEGGLAPGATVMSWRGEDGGIAAAKAGHDVIMTPGEWTYLDHYQSRDIAHEPHAIGGYLPLKKVYQYEPVPATLTAQEATHVIGAQSQVWTEYIRTPQHVEYMAFPRLSAFSEVVWSPKATRNFAEFKDRLTLDLERLQDLDVNFRQPKDSD